jgi:hypothetical protein
VLPFDHSTDEISFGIFPQSCPARVYLIIPTNTKGRHSIEYSWIELLSPLIDFCFHYGKVCMLSRLCMNIKLQFELSTILFLSSGGARKHLAIAASVMDVHEQISLAQRPL